MFGKKRKVLPQPRSWGKFGIPDTVIETTVDHFHYTLLESDREVECFEENLMNDMVDKCWPNVEAMAN